MQTTDQPTRVGESQPTATTPVSADRYDIGLTEVVILSLGGLALSLLLLARGFFPELAQLMLGQ